MTLRCVLFLLISAAFAQDKQPALSAQEKDFEQSMSGVTLVGHYSKEGSTGLTDDKYIVDKVTKLKDGMWQFDARVSYGGQDIKMPLPLRVEWAGDTPVIELTDESVLGMGKFTVRIVLYRGAYAGTWSSAKGHGGQMFGKIVKLEK